MKLSLICFLVVLQLHGISTSLTGEINWDVTKFMLVSTNLFKNSPDLIHSFFINQSNLVPATHLKAYRISKFTIQLNLGKSFTGETDCVLKIFNPYIDEIKIYYRQNGVYNTRTAGANIPAGSRDYQTGNLSFFLPNEALHFPVYFSVITTSMAHFTSKLYSEKEFFKYQFQNQLILGLFFGLFLFFSLYSIFLLVFTWEKMFLYYFVFVVLMLLCNLVVKGLGFIWIWPNAPGFNMRGSLFILAFYILITSIFSYYIFKIRELVPELLSLFYFIFFAEILFLIATIFLDRRIVSIVISSAPQIPAIIILIAGYISYKRGNTSALFIIIGWLFFILSQIPLVFRLNGLMNINFFTEHGYSLGNLIQVFLFMVGSGLWFNLQQEEKRLLRKTNLTLQSDNEKLLEIARKFSSRDDNERFNQTEIPVSRFQSIIGKNILTYKENQVLEFIIEGRTNYEIASILDISINTVKKHLKNIYRKLEVKNRAEVTIKALTMGIIPFKKKIQIQDS